MLTNEASVQVALYRHIILLILMISYRASNEWTTLQISVTHRNMPILRLLFI